MEHCRHRSEFIEEEKPDFVIQMDWEVISNIHPYLQGQRILKFLHDNGIPAIGEVDVEKVEVGRLYWDDYLELGLRTFFYFRNEPTYTKFAHDKEAGFCRLICPICKELCGGIEDHVEETDVPFHGCIHQHKWVAVGEEKTIRYAPVNHVAVSSEKFSIVDKEITKPKDDEIIEPLNRSISFED